MSRKKFQVSPRPTLFMSDVYIPHFQQTCMIKKNQKTKPPGKNISKNKVVPNHSFFGGLSSWKPHWGRVRLAVLTSLWLPQGDDITVDFGTCLRLWEEKMVSTKKFPGAGNDHRQQLPLDQKSGEDPLISNIVRCGRSFRAVNPALATSTSKIWTCTPIC